MPLPLAIPAGYAAWTALGGATVFTAWWVSPMGEPAREATADALEGAYDGVVEMASPRDEEESRSDARAGTTTDTCHNCRRCPVCNQQSPNAPPDEPAYVRENRWPADRETMLNGARRTGRHRDGANIYHWNGGYAHVDRLHRGRGSEIELYDRRYRHIGTMCPACGLPRGPAVPGRDIRREMR